MQRGPLNFYDKTLTFRNTSKKVTGPVLPLPLKPPLSLYTRRPTWDYERDVRLLELSKPGTSLSDIAKQLSKEWNFNLTRNMVAGRLWIIRNAVKRELCGANVTGKR